MCETAINMEQQTVIIRNFLRITDLDIHFRRMAYPPERGKLSATTPEELGKNEFAFIICIRH